MGTHPIFESDFDCLTVKIGENVPTWTRWRKWWQIPHLNGPPSCCSYELRRQHWRQVPLRHCRCRHQRSLEQTSSSRIRRFGHGLREEGQARVAKTGKKGVKKKIIDPFTRKDWYDIKAPSVFKVRDVGKTLVNRTAGTKLASDGLKGRVYEVSLA